MAVGFEHFGQTVAPVAPVAPQQQQQATAQATTTTNTHGPDRLLRCSAYLLLLAGALLLAALIVAVTPLGAIDADITVPFVAVTLAALVFGVAGVL